MKTKHTPGPWQYDESNGMVWLPAKDANDRRCGVLQTSGELKPEFSMQDYYWNGHHDEVRANARLIAAAPELLTALQAFVDMVEDDTIRVTNEGRERLIAATAAANDAISKATTPQAD